MYNIDLITLIFVKKEKKTAAKMTDWRSIIDKYLNELEKNTATALEKVNEKLLKSGQHFDTRIKDYFVKSTKNR